VKLEQENDFKATFFLWRNKTYESVKKFFFFHYLRMDRKINTRKKIKTIFHRRYMIYTCTREISHGRMNQTPKPKRQSPKPWGWAIRKYFNQSIILFVNFKNKNKNQWTATRWLRRDWEQWRGNYFWTGGGGQNRERQIDGVFIEFGPLFCPRNKRSLKNK